MVGPNTPDTANHDDKTGLAALLKHASQWPWPDTLKALGRRLIDYEGYKRKQWRLQDPFADAEKVSSYPAKVNVTLGIITEFSHKHSNYIGACRDLGVPYKLIDISGPDWLDVVQGSGCDAFLVRPSDELTVWKQMFDERLKVMVEDLGKIIYPTYNELWLYESKRRMHYWLAANNVPHPKTWVFYDRQEAMSFCQTCELPIIYKSDCWSSALGVRIFRSRPALLRFVAKCFERGITSWEADPRDRQWGSVLLQEYLPDVAEWRVIRIGKSYFAHQKLKKGEFHSGSKAAAWFDPPVGLLDLARRVTDLGKFTTMNLDTFEITDGRFLVNELQALFGAIRPYQMLVNGLAGRYIYFGEEQQWRFEEGIFCRHGGCILRVADLLRQLGYAGPLPEADTRATVTEEDRVASQRDYASQKSPGASVQTSQGSAQ